jgi:hypothetical protein
VNSPDDAREAHDERGGRDAPDAFDRRIADAARALKRRAPDGSLERIRERAADLGSSIDVAARSLARAAPVGELEVTAFDVRIAAAAQELRGPAPDVYAEILARSRRARFAVLSDRRWVVALAASLLLAIGLLARLALQPGTTTAPELLTTASLAAAVTEEEKLDRESEQLAQRVRGDAALAADERTQPLLEEVGFLDEAIEECRAALAVSQAHAHLRQQLLELTTRRVELLRQAAGR